MSWARFDDQYPDHPKIVEVGPLGMALHLAATCYCARYLTDGFVSSTMLSRLLSFDGITYQNNAVTNALVTNELIRVGLFEVVEGGIMVHDYLEYNPPAAEIKGKRAENAVRQEEWRKKHRDDHGKFTRNAVSNALRNTAPSPSPLTPDICGAKAPRPSKADPRTNSPAIQLIRKITRKNPALINYDEAIEVLGETPDEVKATNCYRLWMKGGRNPIGLGWLDWYKNGIPESATGPLRNNGSEKRMALDRYGEWKEVG
jgi:hypothetical protein